MIFLPRLRVLLSVMKVISSGNAALVSGKMVHGVTIIR